MKSTLSEFIAYFRKHGVLTGSHFAVNIGAGPGGEGSNKNVMMMCESCPLPGISFMTDELRILGDAISTPYASAYNNINMTFLLDSNVISQQYFDYWLFGNDQDSTGCVYNPKTRTFNYYANYVRDITIASTDKAGKIKYQVILHEAYPVGIQDRVHDSNDHEIMKLSVDIKYRYYTVTPIAAKGESFDDSKLKLIQTNMESGMQMPQTTFGPGFTGIYGSETHPATTDWRVDGNKWQLVSDPRLGINMFSSNMRSGAMDILGSASNDIREICQIPSTRSIPELLSGPGITSGSTTTPSLSRGLVGIADGLFDLSNNAMALGNIPSAMGGSLIGIGSTLSALDSIAQIVSGKSPFAGAIRSVVSSGAKLQQVANLGGLPGAITSAGSSIGAAASAFESFKQIASDLPGYSAKSGSAISNLSSLFSGVGSGMGDLMTRFNIGGDQ